MKATTKREPYSRAWLDLADMQVDRATIRRLEKQLKDSDEFEKKSGRVLFFRFYSELAYLQFFAAMASALEMMGFRYEVKWVMEEELTGKE